MRKEIGSFIELDLRNTGEYYSGAINIARLNSARAGIYHACRILNCSSVYIPYYLCPTVKEFLTRKGIKVKSYFISERYEPVNVKQEDDSAIVLVNYFGIIANSYLRKISRQFKNVIIDNCPAFYNNPIDDCYNIYSPRKFFGVPDGCYVVGKNAEKLTDEYDQDFSSETSSFLMKRIEFGSSAVYHERMRNEERIDNADILNMSVLSKALLNSIDYSNIKKKRQNNFHFVNDLYKGFNLVDPARFMDNECVPMIYPLVVEDPDLVEKLKEKQIYTGRWWKHVLSEVPEKSFEAKLSKFLVPIPIDQRYGKEELAYCYKEFCKAYISS
jgi:hypothetical protein